MRKIILMLIILSLASPLLAISGDEAVARFRAKMNGTEKLAGTISWTTASGAIFSGSFRYMRPGKIFVRFSSPANRTIVSNGKRLWIHDSASNICGIQELGANHSGGIAGMIQGYTATASGGDGGYIIRLRAPNASRAYQEIVLNVDSSFMLRRAALRRANGETTTFTLNLLESTGSVSVGTFNFSVPSNAQVIMNPLDIR